MTDRTYSPGRGPQRDAFPDADPYLGPVILRTLHHGFRLQERVPRHGQRPHG